MIAISNLGLLQPLELPTSMTYLLTIMSTDIPRNTPPQAPPMVALTCQQRSSTRSILPTSIGLLMSPPLPLGNLPLHLLLADPPPEGLLDPSFFLPTSTGTIYIKTQVFRILRYYSPVPRNIARRDWVTQNTTHNMTSSIL